MRFYVDAFSELGTARQLGMGVGPIPFTAVVEYSKIFDVDDFEEFLYIIRRMDKVYLESVNKKEVSSGDRGKNNKSSTGR